MVEPGSARYTQAAQSVFMVLRVGPLDLGSRRHLLIFEARNSIKMYMFWSSLMGILLYEVIQISKCVLED